MFDPTAFDNMKVVIEGALYDKDISGEIEITDRNDLFNLAKMSRLFTIAFKLPEQKTTAIWELESNLSNLAAELTPQAVSGPLAGCTVKLKFHLPGVLQSKQYREIHGYLLETWGEGRKITLTKSVDPLMDQAMETMISIEFDRLISEDQMDDLLEMAEVMISTLNYIEMF